MAIWQSLIVCDNEKIPEYSDECGFVDLIELAKNLINNMIVLSTFAFVIVLIYAGFRLLAARGNSSALSEVKTMLWKVLIGYLWILGAWLLVYTITSALLAPAFNIILRNP